MPGRTGIPSAVRRRGTADGGAAACSAGSVGSLSWARGRIAAFLVAAMPFLLFQPLPRRARVGGVIRAAVLVGVIAAIAFSPVGADDAPQRVVDGLQTLYTFEAIVKGVIPDRAGVGEAIDLRIDKPQQVRFEAGQMELDRPVVVASVDPAIRLTQALRQAQQFSLEVWITPAEPDQAGPARIVSLSLDTSKRSLSLVQEKGRYELRLRTSTTSDNGTPSTPTPDGSAVARQTHLVATRTPDGVVRLFLDGKEVATNTVAGDMNRWPDGCRLVVGNEVSGDRPWRGEIALVALYARALSADEIGCNFNAGAPRVVEGVSRPAPPDGAVASVRDGPTIPAELTLFVGAHRSDGAGVWRWMKGTE